MLQQETKRLVKLTHCPPNPTLEYAKSIKIKKGTKEIVSEGGGSTLDVGKFLARKNGLKHTAIPTTTGTGSESTRYCVLTVNGRKKTFEYDIPECTVLDPRKAVTLPKLHTLSSGLDALSQCLESLWSKNATRESRNYALAGIELIMQNLPISLKNPENLQARMAMLIGANLSGRAIEITKTNVCHAISYPLTDWYGIPHGIACALSLKYFAKKTIGYDLEPFFKKIGFDPYVGYIVAKRVAEEVIKSPKLKDMPFRVTKKDILNSINVV